MSFMTSFIAVRFEFSQYSTLEPFIEDLDLMPNLKTDKLNTPKCISNSSKVNSFYSQDLDDIERNYLDINREDWQEEYSEKEMSNCFIDYTSNNSIPTESAKDNLSSKKVKSDTLIKNPKKRFKPEKASVLTTDSKTQIKLERNKICARE